MAKNSKIEWCDHTMNFWIGCQEVSPACDHCYARVQNVHWNWVNGWGPDGERRRTSTGNWHKLRKWNRDAGVAGIRSKVFSNSLSDFFDNKAASTWRREAWHYIEQSPNLDFLILTKRPQNIAKMLPDPEAGVKPWGDGWPNVWLGTTVENQEEADRRIPHLLAVPAAVRFLSCEPLLGAVDLTKGHPRINWVIAGGESGPGARPMHPDWARSLRDQCATAGLPFFFKQWGQWREFDHGSVDEEIDAGSEHAASILACAVNPGWLSRDGRFYARERDLPDGVPCRLMESVGKKAAGALLDGVEHKAMPI